MTAIIPQASARDAGLLQASLLHQAGQLTKAEELYRIILRAQPDDVVAINNFARVLQDQGKLDEAAAAFRRLVVLQPDLALAHRNLGIVLCESGRLEESFSSFRRHARLVYETSEDGKSIPPHKAQHDREQHAYVGNDDHTAFHIEGGGRVSGRAVNADTSQGKIAAAWQNNRPQIAVIDNFLTDEALNKLRHFCLASTIWQKVYTAGYLGAMPEHGLGSPLLAQIAEELRSGYPALLGRHPLLQFWGFKYDSRLSGVAIHADFAAVNVNFWITPDEANLDPKSGGLIIWDTPAPIDWDFASYNDGVKAARDFLRQAGAQAITIPYRSNRAVIFDSDLFHETDRLVFKEGYLNRRINLTLLYGRREETGS